MTPETDLLIIGAGPTGLATALFLAAHGHCPRIVEKAAGVSPYSKAFGINVRTMHLLDAVGVTSRFIENGRKMRGLNLLRRGHKLARLNLAAVDDRYPFMCVQGQHDSERILEEALAEHGIQVERGIEATDIRIDGGAALVDLVKPKGTETVRAAKVLGADGANSVVRKSLGFSFDGAAYPEPWRLWDLELDISINPDDGHIFLLDEGGMFVVRHRDNIWRVLGSGPDLLGSLPPGTKTGAVHWQSEFKISNRVAGRFSQGPVFLAGDAAHIHAGIGARGMNLGIEDAYVFSELYNRGELHRFDALRRPVVEKVVGQISRMMAVPRADTAPGRLVRATPWLVTLVMPMVRSRVQPWILGLDHEIAV